MKPNPGPGKLIVLEGLDGAGTTTQSARLADWLRKYHSKSVKNVHVTREPSPGPAGAQIRSVLTRRLTMDGKTLAALFTTDRIDHLYSERGVVERLEAGEWVIMDRYYLSSFAYQALSLSRDELDWLWHLHAPCLIPDVVFFLDVPVEICMERVGLNRGLHFELFENKESLETVRSKYLGAIRRFRTEGQNIQVIEGTAHVEAVAKNIQRRLRFLFLSKTGLAKEEQEKLLDKWPKLRELLKDIENNLQLYLLTITRLPGGYQLKLANEEGEIYNVRGYYSNDKEELALVAVAKQDDTLERLEDICSVKFPSHNPSQLTLWEDF